MTSTPTRPVDNVVIATKGLQDRNINIIAGTTVENKGKLILTHRGLCQSEDNERNLFIFSVRVALSYSYISLYIRFEHLQSVL